jgi:methanogen homocitrate synthase
VEYHLDQVGIEANSDQVAEILARVKQKGAEKRGLLTHDEFMEIVSTVI